MHRCFAIAVLAAVGPFRVVVFNPLIYVGLQLIEAAVDFLPKRYLIKLLEDSTMKALLRRRSGLWANAGQDGVRGGLLRRVGIVDG